MNRRLPIQFKVFKEESRKCEKEMHAKQKKFKLQHTKLLLFKDCC